MKKPFKCAFCHEGICDYADENFNLCINEKGECLCTDGDAPGRWCDCYWDAGHEEGALCYIVKGQ